MSRLLVCLPPDADHPGPLEAVIADGEYVDGGTHVFWRGDPSSVVLTVRHGDPIVVRQVPSRRTDAEVGCRTLAAAVRAARLGLSTA